LGRGDAVDIHLEDPFASTHHARISWEGSTVMIEDLGSTNGTYLDRTKVTSPMPVKIGVPIRIGKTVVELRK
jgi:pSer/pThr/pTyr-binding forkhead associated (FHA) protein